MENDKYNDKAGEESGISHLERTEGSAGEIEVVDAKQAAATGTVNLISGTKHDTVLIPAPSADPRDPLNQPQWRKYLMLLILSIWSCTGNTAVSAAGSLIGFFLQDYIAEGKGYSDIVHLITIPTLTMGLGDLVLIPLALAVGRRPVYLLSGAILFVGCIVASQNTNYDYHLAIRVVLGFAAGQSGALVPLMIKETFFIHERAHVLSFQAAFQTIVGCIMATFSSNIAASVGWKNWYLVYAGISGALLVLAFFFVQETKYERPLEAYNGLSATTPAARSVYTDATTDDAIQVTHSTRPALDYATYPKHTFLSSINLMPMKPDWKEMFNLYLHMGQMIWLPNVLLIILANSWFLGVNIGMGTTYATPLAAPPYNWAQKWVGLAQLVQIPVAFVALPTLGIFSDKMITYFAKRNGGQHEPEVRLTALAVPIFIGVFSTVLFGAAYQNPYKFHWFALLFGYGAEYFAFIAASVAGQTYLLDAYPTRTGASLTLVCVGRGLISFGMSYSLVATTTNLGYLHAYGMYAGVIAAFGLLFIGLYIYGKRLRNWSMRFIVDDLSDGKPHIG